MSNPKTTPPDARADLLSSSANPDGGAAAYPASDDPYGTNSDRTRLLAGTAILEDGSKRLQQSQRIALETESQGADILLNLCTQREQIENSRNTLQRADLAIDGTTSSSSSNPNLRSRPEPLRFLPSRRALARSQILHTTASHSPLPPTYYNSQHQSGASRHM